MAIFHIANYHFLSNPSNLKRFTVDSVKLSDDVTVLKQEVAKRLSIISSDMELVYCGKCLKEGYPLETQNIKYGVTLHVLKSVCENKTKPTPHKMDATEIQQLVLALRTAVMNPAYRDTIQRLSKPEVLENIIAATPSLADDPIAIAILQDPDLILQLTDVNSINRMVEAHPALAEAANHVAAAVHEESGTSSNPSSAAHMLASAYLYSLDAMSDDDDDIADANASLSDDLTFGNFSAAITQAQLASALAAVASGGGAGTSSGSGITPELFSQAMQEAITATSQGYNQAQLQQLRDMGINDETLSIRALEMTGGDVHAALELIFGDFMEAGRSSPRNPPPPPPNNQE